MRRAGLLLLLGLASPAAAEPPARLETSTSAVGLPGVPTPAAGLPEADTTCPGAQEFGGSAAERAAFCAYQGSERPTFVSMRTFAEQALREGPRSWRAHFLMGVAQHQGEGNLPKALFHLEQADLRFTAEHGRTPGNEGPEWRNLARLLLELVHVHGEMDHHQEKLEAVDQLQRRLGIDYGALKAWPLLKLKRWAEARLYVTEALERADETMRPIAETALCAIESELRRRQEAYDACLAAARQALEPGATEGAIELSNAAAAASELFRFDEAERYLLLATERPIEGSVNPWGRLVQLYLRQGRFSEALSAWRNMIQYRRRRPAYLDQQDQSDADQIGAALLLVAGRTKDALPITERSVHRPDRQGTSSANAEQNEAGAAILARVAKLERAREMEADAAVGDLSDALRARAEAVRLRFEAWLLGRQALETLSDEERLTSTLRPECPGSIELPAWLDAEVIHVVGPGVARAAIQIARGEESLPEELAELIFRGLEAEAAWLAGDAPEALEAAEWVVERLPDTDALLKARAAMIAAEAAAELRQPARALAHYGRVLAIDPRLFLRMGVALPVRLALADASPEAAEARERLESSPMFREESWGFTLALAKGTAQLQGDDGSVLKEVQAEEAKKGSDEAARGRRLARAVQRELLLPELDITQQDVRSLDGSLGSGGKAAERARSVLRELLDEPPPAERPE